MTPARDDVRAYRWATFAEPFPIVGIDLTGATAAMQVRAYPDAPGAALATATVAIGVTTDDGVTTSTLTATIAEATIEALLPFPANGTEPGAELRLAYDIVVTTSALGKRRWIEGAFIIVPGVTH